MIAGVNRNDMLALKRIHGPGAKKMVISKSDPRVILGYCKCSEIEDMKERYREEMQNSGFSG